MNTNTDQNYRGASEAQVNFAAKLLAEKDFTGYRNAEAFRRFATGQSTIPMSSARAAISEVIALPAARPGDASAPVAAMPEVPEGRYAVEMDGTLKFYKVDRPTEGKWKGYTFVKVQASDDFHPIKSRDAKAAILRAIAKAGPRAAMIRYGRELGVCGDCGRTLTDENSRAAGIGPICAAK